MTAPVTGIRNLMAKMVENQPLFLYPSQIISWKCMHYYY